MDILLGAAQQRAGVVSPEKPFVPMGKHVHFLGAHSHKAKMHPHFGHEAKKSGSGIDETKWLHVNNQTVSVHGKKKCKCRGHNGQEKLSGLTVDAPKT